MSEDVNHFVCIRSWDVSYFDSSVRKWIYGQLKLATDALLFLEKKHFAEHTTKPVTCFLKFSNIKCINKAMSTMIFPSLTAKTMSDETHWFASFEDRNSAFVVISHFFEASLLESNSKRGAPNQLPSSQSSFQKTELGRTLLNSVHDSNVTLKKAASSLLQQGEQLSAMSCTMHDIQQDLAVAERVTAGLDSWLGRWKMPAAAKPGELIFLKDGDIPDVLDVEVLYTKVIPPRVGPQTCGVCRVALDGITVLDLNQKVIHHFKWSEVSRVRAVSPWEIVVTQYLIGQPDLSFNIVSSNMPSIIRKIMKFAESKLEYVEPPADSLGLARDSGVFGLPVEPPFHLGSFSEGDAVVADRSRQDKFDLSEQHQRGATAVLEERVISDAEVAELSAALDSIKTTALGINSEQDRQLQDLDDLTSSVVRANDRIRGMNKTMGKLLK